MDSDTDFITSGDSYTHREMQVKDMPTYGQLLMRELDFVSHRHESQSDEGLCAHSMEMGERAMRALLMHERRGFPHET
jgi:hypothetical protein